MMVVMAVMAGALHLIETLRADTMCCQISRLRPEGNGQRMGAMPAARQWTRPAVIALCVSIGILARAQNQDRDSSGVPKTSTSAPAPEQRIDINHASVDQLLKIPGMTQSWAARIVRYRPYRTKQDLFDKGIVSSEVYDRIKDFVIAHRDKN
jgi:Helix-hairpin-helix motif